MQLLINSQISMVQPLKFGNGKVISSHTVTLYWVYDYLTSMLELTHWPLGDFNQFSESNFQKRFGDWCWGFSCKIVLIWMPPDLTDDRSTLVHVMAWCRQATSHYLSQCWPRSLSPYLIHVNKSYLSWSATGPHPSVSITTLQDAVEPFEAEVIQDSEWTMQIRQEDGLECVILEKKQKTKVDWWKWYISAISKGLFS